eukprot:3674086-Pyramimonas_sp.AAC.1
MVRSFAYPAHRPRRPGRDRRIAPHRRCVGDAALMWSRSFLVRLPSPSAWVPSAGSEDSAAPP